MGCSAYCSLMVLTLSLKYHILRIKHGTQVTIAHFIRPQILTFLQFMKCPMSLCCLSRLSQTFSKFSGLKRGSFRATTQADSSNKHQHGATASVAHKQKAFLKILGGRIFSILTSRLKLSALFATNPLLLLPVESRGRTGRLFCMWV